MTLGHITHHLSCPGCQEAHRRDPAAPRTGAQCALALDGDREPPVWCPHPHGPGAEFCDVHAEAVAAAAAALGAPIPDDPGELASLIADCRLKFLQGQKMMAAAERAEQRLRRLGAPAEAVAGIAAQRRDLDAMLDPLVLFVRAGEARLAAMNRPGSPDGS